MKPEAKEYLLNVIEDIVRSSFVEVSDKMSFGDFIGITIIDIENLNNQLDNIRRLIRQYEIAQANYDMSEGNPLDRLIHNQDNLINAVMSLDYDHSNSIELTFIKGKIIDSCLKLDNYITRQFEELKRFNMITGLPYDESLSLFEEYCENYQSSNQSSL